MAMPSSIVLTFDTTRAPTGKVPTPFPSVSAGATQVPGSSGPTSAGGQAVFSAATASATAAASSSSPSNFHVVSLAVGIAVPVIFLAVVLTVGIIVYRRRKRNAQQGERLDNEAGGPHGPGSAYARHSHHQRHISNGGDDDEKYDDEFDDEEVASEIRTARSVPVHRSATMTSSLKPASVRPMSKYSPNWHSSRDSWESKVSITVFGSPGELAGQWNSSDDVTAPPEAKLKKFG